MNARAMRRLTLGLPGAPFSITVATFQADNSYHLGILLMSLATGIALKLPKATGSGTQLEIVVGVVCTTSPYYVISTNPSTDIFAGSISTLIDTSNTGKAWKTANNSNTITLNGTTTGGVTIGDTILLADIQAGVWSVEASIVGSGAIATPFSHV